ncbi:MAG TPA: ABC transporter ATP-binding protein [Trebonia sp.]|nr:ABC transporter ATP-binding protein [Trebonia sp.]
MLSSIGSPSLTPPDDTRGKADTIGRVQAAIEARAVTYRTRAGEVTVRDVSLTVGHGELVAIIGGTGSGKATLLNSMSGLWPPTSGAIFRHVPGDARQAGGPRSGQIGYVPRGDTVHPVLPLARALRYTVALRGVHASPAAVEYALGMVGLTAEATVPCGTLDPGDRKRAAIAAELLAGRRQLFLDEPTTGLDPAQATETVRLLRRLSRGGMTVLLTTSSPLDAARCDKVAVLATGGHLAFFGTPAAARAYFGADSLEEIYERLAGLGDPAAAWSRRFFHFSRTRAGFTQVPTTPRAPGPVVLVPDAAGPHSAGRPGLTLPGVSAADDDTDLEEEADAPPFAVPAAAAGAHGPNGHGGGGGALRQLSVLIRRNAEVLARARRTQVILAVAPVVVLIAFCALLGAGALDGPAAVTLAWAVLGGLAAGLAYQLPDSRTESGVLRGETFSGLSRAVFALAKAAVLLPVLAAADALILAVPAIADRLQSGFAAAYLAVLIASAVGLAAALAVPVVSARR